MAIHIPHKQHNYLLWTKHSPCFPSQHDVFLQVSGAQFLALFLWECRIIGKLKTLWFWYMYETWNICPGPGKKHNLCGVETFHISKPNCTFFYVHVTVHRNKFLYNKTNQMHQFPKFTLAWNSTCFRQFCCPSSGVYSLYTWHWCMSYRFVDSFRAGSGWSCSKAVYKPVWHIPLLSV